MDWPRFVRFFSPLFSVFIAFYFAYHLMRGDRGVLAWIRLEKQRAEAEQTLTELKSENQALQHKIYCLQNRSLDLDLLGEEVYLLGLAHPDDIVILAPEYTFSKEDLSIT